MKNDKSIIEEIREVKDYTQKKINQNQLSNIVVSTHLQQEELEKLEIGLRYEQFFFVVDVIDFKIIHARGIDIIGYNNEQFDMFQYLQAIPSKGLLQLFILMWRNIFNFNVEEDTPLQFLKPKFIVQMPIKHANGDIFLVKRTISPFQFTKSGMITQYLSEFVVIKKTFDNEPPEPRFTDIPEKMVEKYAQFINRDFIWENSPFSPKEMIIVNTYAHSHPETSVDIIAKELNLKVSTLKFYNKAILRKAQDFLGEHYIFTTAREVAVFFKKSGILK